MSLGAPGGNGKINRIGLVGYVCASDGSALIDTAADNAMNSGARNEPLRVGLKIIVVSRERRGADRRASSDRIID
jgi:hypothetical protein